MVRVSLCLGNISNIRSPTAKSAVNYRHIILSEQNLSKPRCALLCHIHTSIISTASAAISWTVKHSGLKIRVSIWLSAF